MYVEIAKSGEKKTLLNNRVFSTRYSMTSNSSALETNDFRALLRIFKLYHIHPKAEEQDFFNKLTKHRKLSFV